MLLQKLHHSGCAGKAFDGAKGGLVGNPAVGEIDDHQFGVGFWVEQLGKPGGRAKEQRPVDLVDLGAFFVDVDPRRDAFGVDPGILQRRDDDTDQDRDHGHGRVVRIAVAVERHGAEQQSGEGGDVLTPEASGQIDRLNLKEYHTVLFN